VNKWDAVEKDANTMVTYTQHVRQELNFMDYVPILFISAKTGQRIDQVLPLALRVQEERLTGCQLRNQSPHATCPGKTCPPSHGSTALKIYYGAQVRNDPRFFLLHVNDQLAHFTYLRFWRTLFARNMLLGHPIRIVCVPAGNKQQAF